MVMAYLYVAGVGLLERQVWETIDAEITGLQEQYGQFGPTGLIRVINERSTIADAQESIYLLVERDGRKLAGNLEDWPDRISDAEEGFRFELKERPVLARGFLLPGKMRLLVGRDIKEQVANQQALRNAILVGAFVMSILGVIAGYIVSRWMVSRLERVNRTTRQIMAGDFSRRITINGGGDEFDELAQNVNDMLERIERLLAGMRQVTDNIAHDLRTPLHRLRSRIEVALMQDVDAAQSRSVLEETLRDADGLIETFNALLRIAKLEAGAPQSDWEPLDLAALAHEITELYEPLAEEKSIRITFSGEPTIVSGNRQLLAQAIANLTDNAIKYTQSGGKITIATTATPRPVVQVADNGPGIPATDRQRALERFVRLIPERSGPGNGLGLSLVQAVARLHEAVLELGDNNPGLVVAMIFSPSAAETEEADGTEP